MKDAPPDCVADMAAMTVTTENGQVIPITYMLDADGEDTDDPMEATVIVCGPDRNGYWLTITLGAWNAPTGYVH